MLMFTLILEELQIFYWRHIRVLFLKKSLIFNTAFQGKYAFLLMKRDT